MNCLRAGAALVLGVRLPTEPELWLRFAWVFLLGIVTMALLGVALSALPRSSSSAMPSSPNNPAR